ncbi:hypothetical protein DSBG_3920 [Desulfosporosinus sp. BG]|nr:hypothetical protein DSBG_3920 [Desulfosporosinus sp. BG]
MRWLRSAIFSTNALISFLRFLHSLPIVVNIKIQQILWGDYMFFKQAALMSYYT